MSFSLFESDFTDFVSLVYGAECLAKHVAQTYQVIFLMIWPSLDPRTIKKEGPTGLNSHPGDTMQCSVVFFCPGYAKKTIPSPAKLER